MSWAAVAVIASAVIAAGTAAYSGEQSRKVSSYNADIANRQAEEARKKAEFQEQREREKNEALLQRQRLAFDVAGVTSEGSPTNLLMDTAKKMELDALAIRYGGVSSGAALEAEAQLQRMRGKTAQQTGWWNAGSSLLSGATSVAKTYGAK